MACREAFMNYFESALMVIKIQLLLGAAHLE